MRVRVKMSKWRGRMGRVGRMKRVRVREKERTRQDKDTDSVRVRMRKFE